MSSNFSVLTLGDGLITMNPAETGPLRFVTSFSRKVGGAELNFAIGCARLGLKSKWVSRLGNDEFGRVIYNFARSEGIDVSDVKLMQGYPTSLNFKEIQEGGSGKTFYYRHQSPMLTMEPEDISKDMFEGVNVIHLSGVFLSINPKNAEIVKQVLEIAKEIGIPVSFDPNLRLKMWTIEEARATFMEIFPYVDILLTGLDEIELILEDSSDEALTDCAKRFQINQFVIKDGANGSRVLTDGTWYEKEAFKVNPVDTVGAGDGFDAGYIYAYLNSFAPQESLELANGVGALVTTVYGDNEGLPLLEEVLPFIRQEKGIER
ncbi:sugar kinase [Sporosarcina sp. ANT_H38]|uniref:sugar kinase n=1 Tax=Sporosarcina sp. ANT_H38 TaxID=2597358 RepID=UPI0011F12132|nr:sugar kinase [Sporosarcina sp. ANT_H38]KAA0966423.1 sugar kinase [Sporosarcina sp. ANT_H38]